MIQASISRILKAIAKHQGEGALPTFAFLDSLGNAIASSLGDKEELPFEVQLDGAGQPRVDPLPPDTACHVVPVSIYGKPAGYLLALDVAQRSDTLPALTELARGMVAFAAEKNFELDDLSAALNRMFEEKSFLYDITAELGTSSDLVDFCARLANRIGAILEAPRAVVCLGSKDRTEYRIVGACGLESLNGQILPANEGIIGTAIESGKIQLIEDVSRVQSQQLTDLEREAKRCLLVAPLMAGSSGGCVGALCVMDGGRSGNFTSEEAKLLGFIAEYVGSVISGLYLVELKKEVQIAQRIIDGILPDKAPEVPGYALAGRLSPARVVGGDYYDYLDMGQGKTGVIIADVSGHTLSATLLVTVARAAIHWAASDSEQGSSAEVLQTVCRRLHPDLSRAEFFMSMFLFVLGEDRQVQYSNAGHPPALLYRASSKTFEELDGEGMVAGLLREVDFEEHKVQLEVGDLLILFTDGITEAMPPGSQDMFGYDRLKDVIARSAAFPPEEIVEAIFQEARSYAEGEIEDDLTVIVVKGSPVTAKVESAVTDGNGDSQPREVKD